MEEITVAWRFCGIEGGVVSPAKLAVTVLFEVMLKMVQVMPEPLQAPPQEEKVDPGLATALIMIEALASKEAEQLEVEVPQLIVPDWLNTLP